MSESMSRFPTAADLKPVLELAKAFHQQKPWRHIGSDDLFAIEDPVTGEHLYCAILGGLGEFYALNIYPGDSGLSSFATLLNMGEVSMLAGQHYLAQQELIQVEFTDRENLSSRERKAIKEAGVSFRGRNAWPQFLRFKPGCPPSTPDIEDRRVLCLALEEAAAIARQVAMEQLDVTPVIEDNDITLYVRTPHKSESGTLTWRDTWDTIPLFLPGEELAFDELPCDELRLGRMKRAKLPRHAIWEVHTGYVMLPMEPDPANPEEAHPYMPHIQAIMEQESGMALHMLVTSPQQARQTLQEAFLDALELAEAMPEAVLVLTPEAEVTMRSICKVLEIPLISTESLPHTERLVQGFLADLAGF